VTIHVVQGERKQAAQNKSLGRFDLTDLPPAPRGTPQIEVSFDIDANGILNVSAKDKATGREQSIRITASSGLSESEIEKMVQDAEANAEADRQFAELASSRNNADAMVHAAQKTLAEAGDKVEAGDREAIEAAIQGVEQALEGDDREAIDKAVESLTEATSSLAQRMYSEEQAAEAGGATGGESGGQDGGDDDVVDAEFEEVRDDK